MKQESGPNLLTRLPMPNKKEINAFFRGKDMLEVLGYQLGKSAFGTRKDRTAENIAIQVAFNKAMEVVQETKGFVDIDSNETEDTKYKTIAYSKLTIYLVDAIKELTKRVEELEKENKILRVD